MKGFRKKPLNSNSNTFTFVAQLNESDIKKALLNLLLDFLQYSNVFDDGTIQIDGWELYQYKNYLAKCFCHLPNSEQLAVWGVAIAVRKNFLLYEGETNTYVLSRELLKSKAGRTRREYLVIYSHIQDPPQQDTHRADEVKDIIESLRKKSKRTAAKK